MEYCDILPNRKYDLPLIRNYLSLALKNKYSLPKFGQKGTYREWIWEQKGEGIVIDKLSSFWNFFTDVLYYLNKVKFSKTPYQLECLDCLEKVKALSLLKRCPEL